MNPDSTLARIAAQEGWEVLRFDRLHRKLKIAAAALAAAAAGGVGPRGDAPRCAAPGARTRPPDVTGVAMSYGATT